MHEDRPHAPTSRSDAASSVAGFARSGAVPARPPLGQHRQAMAGVAQATQHHRELRLRRQRAVVEEFRPSRPIPAGTAAARGGDRPCRAASPRRVGVKIWNWLRARLSVAYQVRLRSIGHLSWRSQQIRQRVGTGKGGNWQTFCPICGEQTLSSDRTTIRNFADRACMYRCIRLLHPGPGVTEAARSDYPVSKRPDGHSGRHGWNWLRRARRASPHGWADACWRMRWSRRASTTCSPCRARASSTRSTACTTCGRS